MPRPQVVRALLDTGAERTCVPAATIAALGLSLLTARGRNQTVSGQVGVRLVEVAVGFPAAVTGGPPAFWGEAVEVVELTAALGGIDALVGRDLLLTSRLTLDGPAGSFSLEV